MVFNGEIYNHLNLRVRLGDRIDYRSSGDAETLIRLFEYWGVERTVNALDGMFAIALYDAVEGKCHLMRDFAGIKPLFYGFTNGSLVFASQYDQIAKHSLFHRSPVDPQVLMLYLMQHYMPAPFGLIKNTAQVAPGELLTFTENGVQAKTIYWELPSFRQPSVSDKKGALKFLEEILQQSVRAELLSDAVSCTLSGGTDRP